jgi:Co/Zn/Cd efflux system component
VVGVILCALVLATVGEIIRRLFYGGAPDAGSLIWLGVIALIAHVLCASRLMRYQPGLLGLPGLWALARVGVQSDLVILAAGLLTLPIRAPWPDLAAAIFLIWLNRRALADGLAGVRRAFTGRP